MKGLVYITTDRGLLRVWLKMIGRRDDDRCECGEAQDAAHLMGCLLVGDGKGRTREECVKDRE